MPSIIVGLVPSIIITIGLVPSILLLFDFSPGILYIYTVEYNIEKTETFSAWLHGLKDVRAKARIRARIERAGKGNLGDWAPEGGEVRAMRIDYGPGYRVYFTIRGKDIVILLCGGDKGTQETDIALANKLLKEIA